MSNYHQNTKPERVSALDTTLKFLMDAFYKIKAFIGVILIDKAMRDIVYRYDKRHQFQTRAKKNDSEEICQLQEQIKLKDDAIKRLELTVMTFKSKEEELINQSNALRKDINQLKEGYDEIVREKNNISSQVTELNKKNSLLLSRCLPESEIPTMIYYAQGDTTGQLLRKVSTLKSPEHLYKIMTVPGNARSAEFEPVVNANIKEIIDNRNITLIACDIIGIAPNATNITVLQRGKAVCVNNKWEITSKAKISLS